jgi:uncharacterized protein (TIGR02147 family)
MKPRKNESVSIFNFFDYREYLNAVYNQKKNQQSGFSFRSFSRDAGITSPNYLLRVLKGARHLSLEYVPKFCKALRLSGDEAQFLEALVCFNNEKKIDHKEQYLRKLLTLRCRRGQHRIEDKKLQFFGKWYYPVVRELATVLDFMEDYNLLARSCLPRITAVQAKNAVAYLVKNGFIIKNAAGRYNYSEPVISSGDEVNSTLLRKYHRNNLFQCAQALDTIAKEERDISSLTMAVSRKTYYEMKKEIQDFRKRLLAMARADTNPEMVCLTGFQLIPRSEVSAGEVSSGDSPHE